MPNASSKSAVSEPSANKNGAEHRQIDQTLEHLENAYASQLSICSLLESIADTLPELPHAHVSQTLITMLEGSWAKQLIVEEEKVYGLIERNNEQNTFILNFIDQLRQERQSDEDLASELIATLETILLTNTLSDPASMGYMLRGIFETKRRQVGLKKSVILPLVEKVIREKLQ